MKADLGRLVRFIEQRDPELTIARERGWRDYRTIKSFIYSRSLPAPQHARPLRRPRGGPAAGPLLRRLRRASSWLPDPETIVVRAPQRAKAAAAPPADLSEADAPLFEQLKAWRLKAADGQARLHRRPQHDADRDRRTPPRRRAEPRRRSAASAPASSPSTPPSPADRRLPHADLNAALAGVLAPHDLPRRRAGVTTPPISVPPAGRDVRPGGRIRLGCMHRRERATALVALAAVAALPGRRRPAPRPGRCCPRARRSSSASATPATRPTSASSAAALRQAPGADRELPHLGLGLPRVDRTLAGGAGAADPAHHHRRQQRRPRADQPALDRPGLRRRIPDPAQQALLGEEDARLHPAAGRAQPLPQRLRLLRLRRQRRATPPTSRAGTGSPSAAST